MTEAQILSEVMARLGSGTGVTSISKELQGVLYDISGRADFLTTVSGVETEADKIDYDEPEGLKRIYECSIQAGALLEKRTFRQYLQAVEDGSAAASAEPKYYARRHGKLFFWPVADGVYTVDVDYARFHPATWTDISFGAEFSEAIYEGVLAALYKGQLFEKLRLSSKKVTTRDIAESGTDAIDSTTTTEKEGTADDSTVTVDEDIGSSLTTDDDSDVLTYEFPKDFPEIKKHTELYEAEIAKLIANLELDAEVAVVQYRDI